MAHTLSTLAAKLGTGLFSVADTGRLAASRAPFTQHDVMVPHTDSTLWGTTHFGVFVPDLPAPHRYVNTMTLIGAAGAEVFDQDYLAAPDARNTTTVLSSTAKGDQHFYRAYDASTDCEFAPDGSFLRWGDELTITVDLPTVTVRGRYPGFDVDLVLTVTDEVSYFVKTPLYDHFSLAAPYTGTVDGVKVSGLGTFEYARIRAMVQALTPRPVPAQLKLPIDLFTYQVIDIDPSTQLLLTDVRARENVACRLLHVRRLGEPAQVYDDVALNVTEWATRVDERGRSMRVPKRFTWAVCDGRERVLEIQGTVDSPWRYGHGPGYVAAYSYSGTYRSEPVSGSAYIEWIDVRP